MNIMCYFVQYQNLVQSRGPLFMITTVHSGHLVSAHTPARQGPTGSSGSACPVCTFPMIPAGKAWRCGRCFFEICLGCSENWEQDDPAA
ncbi:MAG: hypothetical protein DWH82_13185 [Planctomycetota bacterium]|nr:MAG: hypothetical protein DWH82_13185 [Planctomycetota bacterium]